MNLTLAPITSLSTRSDLKLDIRLAEPSEQPSLEGLFGAGRAEDCRFRFIAVPDFAARMTPGSIQPDDPLQIDPFLAFAGDALAAGALLARDTKAGTAEIVLAIHAEWKGHGIGGTLLEFAILAAKERGVKTLWSIEEHANPSGMEFALEIGFAPHPIEEEPSLVRLEMRF